MMITTFSGLAHPSLRAPADALRVLDDSTAPSLRGTTTKPTPGSLRETATLSEVLCHGGYQMSAVTWCQGNCTRKLLPIM